MIIRAVHIQSSDNTPEVLLDPEGTIRIRGQGLCVMKTEFSEKILDWIDMYLNNPAEVTYVIIRLEYLNSSSTSTLFSILKKISMVLLRSKKLIIKWYYEEDDDDIFERGEYIAAALNIPFEYLTAHKNQEDSTEYTRM